MSEPKPMPSKPLLKTKSWSLDTLREAAWLRRKKDYRRMQRGRCKSFTDSDLDELQACFELGFGLDSPVLDPKLSDAFPALEFYHAVNKQYSESLFGSSFSSMIDSSDSDTSSSSAAAAAAGGSPSTSLFHPGDDQETKKMRLRQWAQVVACTVRIKHSPN